MNKMTQRFAAAAYARTLSKPDLAAFLKHKLLRFDPWLAIASFKRYRNRRAV